MEDRFAGPPTHKEAREAAKRLYYANVDQVAGREVGLFEIAGNGTLAALRDRAPISESTAALVVLRAEIERLREALEDIGRTDGVPELVQELVREALNDR